LRMMMCLITWMLWRWQLKIISMNLKIYDHPPYPPEKAGQALRLSHIAPHKGDFTNKQITY
jgi:hypothetical protein